jgi:hypothetical protein
VCINLAAEFHKILLPRPYLVPSVLPPPQNLWSSKPRIRAMVAPGCAQHKGSFLSLPLLLLPFLPAIRTADPRARRVGLEAGCRETSSLCIPASEATGRTQIEGTLGPRMLLPGLGAVFCP